jgi:hypothetical protein
MAVIPIAPHLNTAQLAALNPVASPYYILRSRRRRASLTLGSKGRKI